ncbi:hypothetical protein HU200_049050 [Digitaria exilis]|uniref:F-box domain-containing protein n=1 Tax=Digitaria exilis TaxID=1010633 RepID=A0A835AU79_9POAL|nr:hypothetical protein HU200_049050 [Digitaria exilis]
MGCTVHTTTHALSHTERAHAQRATLYGPSLHLNHQQTSSTIFAPPRNMAAAGRRCLSDLPDELLQRILFLVPGKDAASTSVLSRRWRSLWLASGAVHLDSRRFVNKQQPERNRKKRARRDDDPPRNNTNNMLLHRVDEALFAATAPITRLTLVVADDGDDDLELHVEAADVEDSYRSRKGRRRLSFGAMSSSVLRVLRITGSASPSPVLPRGTFPRLGELHLNRCTVPLPDLQSTIGAAPKLSTLHMESCCLKQQEQEEGVPVWRLRRLVCPAVSDLVFADCKFQWDHEQIGLELDAPGYFRHQT